MNSVSPAIEPIPEAESQIAWVLAHPEVSDWLKQALRSAADRNPVHLLNDLEMLTLLLRTRAQALIDQQRL